MTLITLFYAALLTCQVALAIHWNADVGVLVTERLDPIISPNAVSQHMHTILGGSAFGASYNYADSVKSTCTTFPVSADKSNYWTPSIYWINNSTNTTTFTPIRTQNHVYYFIDRPTPATPITPFPPGIRIIAGNPMAKSAVPNYVAAKFHCRTDPNNFDAPGDVIQDNFNIGQDCPAGLLIEVHFPSCWDGINLYKSDQSHMAYPTQTPFFGQCPWSHPIRLPGIMIEVYAMTSEVAPGKDLAGNMVWANGDTTGYGVHGDFTNGWDGNVLGQALNDTTCSSSDMRFVDCPVFKPYVQGGNCAPQKGVMAESFPYQIGVPIAALPGCNLLWGATGPKPSCSTTPPQPNIKPFQGTDGSLVPATPAVSALPTTPGWSQVGCIADGNDPNALLVNSTRFYDANMTQDNCLNSCLKSGFSYAAVGLAWGSQWACTCGTAVNSNAWTWTGMCNLTCPGTNASCGGSGAHSVFYAPKGTTPAANTSPPNLGCYVDPSDSTKPTLESTATYSYTDWNNMSQPACLQECANRGLDWAGLKNGATCYCGSLSTFSLGGGNWVSPNLCSAKCTGNSTQTCGTWNGMNVLNITASGYSKVVPDKPDGYVECYSDGGGNALNGPRWTDGSNSPQRCTYGCAELGYSYASVWNTNVCLCGNSFDTSKWSSLPAARCSNACPGNSNNMTCGGPGNGELYKTSGQTAAVAKAKAARPSSWQGCYPNSIPSDLTVGDGAQSVEKCMATCTKNGMAFAALGNGWQCRCSKSDPRGSVAPVPASISCTQTCNGASNETCGGSNSVDLYALNAVPGNTTSSAVISSTIASSGSATSSLVVSSSASSSSSVASSSASSLASTLASSSASSSAAGSSSAVVSRSASSSTKSTSSVVSSSKASSSSSPSIRTVVKSTSASKSSSTTVTSTVKSSSSSASKSSAASQSSSSAAVPAVSTSSQASSTSNAPASSSSTAKSSSISSTSPSTSTSASTSASTSSTQSSASAAPSNVALSCASDIGTLNGPKYSSNYMTNDVCAYWCLSAGYAQAGVSGTTCYCGNNRPSVSSDACTTPCISNSAQMCGGSKAVSLFSTSDLGSLMDPTKPTDSTGYLGCWKDSSSRLLRGTSSSSGSMTNQMCASTCAARGYSMGGTENGRECYCGSKYEGGLIRVADSDCSMSCVGNKSQKCGGGYRVSVYDSKTILAGANTPGKRRYRCSSQKGINFDQVSDGIGPWPKDCPV